MDKDLPIVDAHHHLWDLEGALRYPWLESGEHGWLGDYSRLRRSYLPAEYRRDTALHKVIATVHIEAEADRSQQLAETAWLTRIATETGMPNVIVAHAWVDTPNAEDIVAAQAANPLVRGIRSKPVTAPKPGKPTISGTPIVGQVLTASPGTWTGSPSFSYQWLRCSASGQNCNPITGATSQTYTPVSGDVGFTLMVTVTGTGVVEVTASRQRPSSASTLSNGRGNRRRVDFRDPLMIRARRG